VSEEKGWEVPGVGKLVVGIKTELMRVSSNDVVVHVQFPPGTPKERQVEFAKALRKEFPPRVRMAFTSPGVKLNVSRPKVINLTIANSELTMVDAMQRIEQVLHEEADTITISLTNITWRKP